MAAAHAAPPPSGGSGSAKTLTSRQWDLRARAEAATQAWLAPINQHASDYGVDPALVAAVITVESKGDPNAISRSGAMGLMQLMPAVCEDYGVAEPFNPDSNIRGGVNLLANHLRRYKGDLKRVLAAYNAGPRRADNGSWTRIRETRRYVPTVLAYYEALRPDVEGSPLTAGAPLSAAAVPSVRLLDTMFEVVKGTQSQTESEPVAANGTLDSAADTVLADYVSGRIKADEVQARADRYFANSANPPKSLRAILLTTKDYRGFPVAWEKQAKQSPTPGRFVGVARGSSSGKQVWVVVLASY
jgi:hypothetical protein